MLTSRVAAEAGLADWPWMVAMGAVGHLIPIRALVVAPASLIARFTYRQIIWALIAGYFVFGDLPTSGCCSAAR
jgi:hypothetical protein